MKKEKVTNCVSYETIYQYIYHNKSCGGKLYLELRHKNKKYHERGNDYNTKGIIKNRVSIDLRPKIVERKSRIGDLEIDTVIGAKHQGVLPSYSKLTYTSDKKSTQLQSFNEVKCMLFLSSFG